MQRFAAIDSCNMLPKVVAHYGNAWLPLPLVSPVPVRSCFCFAWFRFRSLRSLARCTWTWTWNIERGSWRFVVVVVVSWTLELGDVCSCFLLLCFMLFACSLQLLCGLLCITSPSVHLPMSLDCLYSCQGKRQNTHTHNIYNQHMCKYMCCLYMHILYNIYACACLIWQWGRRIRVMVDKPSQKVS